MPQTLAKVELRSEEVQEVLNAPPSWLVRWGLGVLLLLIVLVLIIANLVRYPDIIPAEIMLTTQNPPVKMVANSSGKLTRLFHSEGDTLASGEVVAEIENPITTQGIDYMKALVAEVNDFLTAPSQSVDFSDSSYVFGSIQADYSELKKQCTDYYQWVADVYQKKQISNLRSKIEQYGQLIDITEKQAQLARSELANAEEKYRADQLLYREGVLAKMQFYQEESAFRQQQQVTEDLKKSATQNRITLIDLEKQLLDLQHEQAERERNFREGIKLSLHSILNQVNEWQQSYLVNTPVTGKLSYLKPLNKNQFVQTGDLLFAVVPENETYVGIINIPAKGFGKVKTGQAVRIKFDKFPYQEYGQVHGVIRNISLLANEDTYRAEVELPRGLTTSYRKPLDFTPEMVGTAEIITEDLSMLERTFYSIRGVFDQ